MSRRQRVIGNLVLCDTEDPIASETDQVQQRIRAKAFEISMKRGHAGREVDDWLSAESEVIVSPPVEVAEKEGSFIVRIAAAGIDSGNLTIMATRDQFLIKSEFRHEHEPEATIHSCEFKSVMLFRAVRLPAPVDLRTMKTDLKEGILRITARLEAAAEERPKRRVERKGASSLKAGRRARAT